MDRKSHVKKPSFHRNKGNSPDYSETSVNRNNAHMKRRRTNNNSGKKKNLGSSHSMSDQEPTPSLRLNSFRNDTNSNDDDQFEHVGVIHRLPPDFPPSMARPEKGFLRNVAPYNESFRCALQTSYEGFVVDTEVVPNEQMILSTLRSPEMESFFVTDITQPFGLGTTCTPTYVTRCLMGDPGTTYKYLGLRMFAHSWNQPLSELKEILSNRVSKHHLPQLYKHRQLATPPSTMSNSTNSTTSTVPYQVNHTKLCFDICLINRMTMNKNLKIEPLDENNKITVSWHADSSLEHYSTIAVYQTMLSDTSQPKQEKGQGADDAWSIGLRVSHNVEGPKINHGRTIDDDSSDTCPDISPPVAVSLPSNSAYYLLDDFNHHHQHTVLVNKNVASSRSSTRYSLTFRLLRDSHNINDMIDRCQRCISQFHKKGTKIYRYEQLTLNELESEWIRQFYIQGQHHHTVLWNEWGGYFMKLWDYWNQLEARTYQTILFLRHAAEGKCLNNSNLEPSKAPITDELTSSTLDKGSDATLKSERKMRAKRKKAVISMHELHKRENACGESTLDGESSTSLYESFAALLEDRATMRELWLRREAEPVFQKMNQQYRPILIPARFRCTANDDNDIAASTTTGAATATKRHSTHHPLGISPMPGTAHELREIACTIRVWGMAFQPNNPNDLPGTTLLDKLPTTATAKDVAHDPGELKLIFNSVDDSTLVSLEWDGWKSMYDIGLEMQHPWSGALLDGNKTIEVRQYNLPSSLIGRKIRIVETPTGLDGVSGIIGNHFQIDAVANGLPEDSSSNLGPRIVGWCVFSAVKQYKNYRDFSIDETSHLVSSSSKYGWQDGCTTALFGWVVSSRGRVSCSETCYLSGTRRFRSLFQLSPAIEKNGEENRNSSTSPIFTGKINGKKRSIRRKNTNRPIDAPHYKKRRF